ncbi:MAG: hypothetical protein LUH41_06395 [Clostridiales bacterium]|nr:hypothetical protein [Clostridiales bacterium]
MKRPYVAPQLQVEVYELSTSIAQNCDYKVNNGPAIYSPGHYHQETACSDYAALTGENAISTASESNVNFYDSGCCDCYTTGGGNVFWTS